VSIGIGDKIFGREVNLFIGKRSHQHILRILSLSCGDLDDMVDFSLLSIALIVRW